jgi:hypothetical protein
MDGRKVSGKTVVKQLVTVFGDELTIAPLVYCSVPAIVYTRAFTLRLFQDVLLVLTILARPSLVFHWKWMCSMDSLDKVLRATVEMPP